MSTPSTPENLDARLDAAMEQAKARVQTFQHQAEQEYEAIRARFQQFLPIADRVVELAKARIEALKARFDLDMTPSRYHADRVEERSVTLRFKTDVASVEARFALSHDREVTTLYLDYTLEIIPVFFHFSPHERLTMALDGYDEATVARWLDDRIVQLTDAYLEMLFTRQYMERALVSDPVAGVTFPRYFAAATLEEDGKTLHFVSEETKQEYLARKGEKAGSSS